MFDQYSILHFAVGVIMFFWNFSFINGFAIHALFEYLENTPSGMALINKYFVGKGMLRWPGGKYQADGYWNTFGDNLAFAIGYGCAYLLNMMGVEYKWYQR
jgi:hypothetical protein